MSTSSPDAPTPADGDVVLVGTHSLSRDRALLVALVLGVALGVGNVFLGLDFTPRWELVLTLAAAIPAVVLAHEGLHGGLAFLAGHRPLFGCKPPFVYVTFETRLPRGHFLVVALGPVVVLDALCVALFLLTPWKIFFDLCFAINTLGAVGDLWMAAVLLGQERGTLVQDTKTGFEVWKRRA